jgi:hypothetical protein
LLTRGAFLRLLPSAPPGRRAELSRLEACILPLLRIALAALRILSRIVAIGTLLPCRPRLLAVLLLCHDDDPSSNDCCVVERFDYA